MVTGRRCAAFYKGNWVLGTIVRHNVKHGKCTVETSKGTIIVLSNRIRMMDKPIWEC